MDIWVAPLVLFLASAVVLVPVWLASQEWDSGMEDEASLWPAPRTAAEWGALPESFWVSLPKGHYYLITLEQSWWDRLRGRAELLALHSFGTPELSSRPVFSRDAIALAELGSPIDTTESVLS